jgi:TolB-like protein/Tfp pilus assembly protein PilF
MSARGEPIEVSSANARKLFDYLVKSFIEDYMRKKYVFEKSGWRSLVESAGAIGLSRHVMYGSTGGFSPFVNELIRLGVVERRIFPGERGRGGQASKFRVAYDRRPVQEFVDRFALGEVGVQGLARPLDRLRVAVLPFASLSPDPNDEYFADGMTEEMISTLSNISNLTVISRTSAMRYKGADRSLIDIGRGLGVGTILEGSVRKEGNQVRISVQLLDAAEDKHLWAHSYDRELQNVFAVQSDIAKNVADALRVKLLPSEGNQIQKRPTESSEAHLLYLKGRQYWNKRSENAVKRAIEYFKLAIDVDPSFALAYVGLADSYNVLSDHGYITSAEAAEMARPSTSKALQLDNRLAEAHAAYGWVLAVYDWNWSASEAEFKKAIELNSNYAAAYQWYSVILQMEGRLDEALDGFTRALEVDPLAPMISLNIGETLFALERYDKAIEFFRRALSVEHDFVPALSYLPSVYAMMGEFDEAMHCQDKRTRLVSKSQAQVGSSWAAGLAAIQARSGRTDQARRTLDLAMKSPDFAKTHPTEVARVFSALHEEIRAFEWLENAVSQHESQICYIKADPWFKELRSKPRFRAILRKMGLDKFKDQSTDR